MLINIDNTPAAVRWRYDRDKRHTICTVMPVETNKFVLVGTAKRAENDKFCKETGRKISLARAIASLPKPTRAEIWLAYFRRAHIA